MSKVIGFSLRATGTYFFALLAVGIGFLVSNYEGFFGYSRVPISMPALFQSVLQNLKMPALIILCLWIPVAMLPKWGPVLYKHKQFLVIVAPICGTFLCTLGAFLTMGTPLGMNVFFTGLIFIPLLTLFHVEGWAVLLRRSAPETTDA